MNKNKLGQEAAFSRPHHVLENMAQQPYRGQKGMSKRFYAACVAMQGLCSTELSGISIDKAKNRIPNVVSLAYEYADELLKQENL